MENSILLMILLQIILIFLNAFFACAEIAVISMNDNKLAKMAKEGDKRAVRIAKLTSQPARFLATIQVAITLSGFLGSAFAAENFSDSIVNFVLDLGVSIPQATLDTVAVIFITIVLSYFTLIFGELVPKRLAMRKAESLALAMSAFISAISKIFAPIVWFLTLSTNSVLRILGIDPDEEEENVSEEEIRMMVDVGSEKGTIDHEEKEFIQNVFEFDDITAREIATHRTDVSILWAEETMDEWKETIFNSRHTMYPVCEDSADNVIGILNTKDYFRTENKEKEYIMKNIVKPPYFVPESVKADILFKNMKKSRKHLAVVLDEYGGMTGIITINDLVEQLVGNLGIDEAEGEEELLIEQIDSKTWKINGDAHMDDVSKAVGIVLPQDGYDTFNGFIFENLGAIPQDGTTEEFETNGLLIKITKIVDHQIKSALVCRMETDLSTNETD